MLLSHEQKTIYHHSCFFMFFFGVREFVVKHDAAASFALMRGIIVQRVEIFWNAGSQRQLLAAVASELKKSEWPVVNVTVTSAGQGSSTCVRLRAKIVIVWCWWRSRLGLCHFLSWSCIYFSPPDDESHASIFSRTSIPPAVVNACSSPSLVSLQPFCIPVSEVEVDGDDAQFYFPARTTATATVARTAAEEHQPREATVGSSVLSEALDHYQEIIAKTDFIVAMHPDQAAEAVVDLALHLDVPFFLVPCCVYAKEFPKRHIRIPRRPDTIRSDSDKAAPAGAEPVSSTSSVEGDKEKHVLKQVKSYEDLLQYLQNKDPGIQRSELIGMEGKNVVLWKV